MFVQFYLWSDSIPYSVVDSIWLDAFETQLSCEWWKIQFFIWRHEPSLHRTRATWMMMIFSLKSWRSSLFASVGKNRQHAIENSYCSSFYGCHVFFVGPNLWRFSVFLVDIILKMKAPSSDISPINHGKNPPNLNFYTWQCEEIQWLPVTANSRSDLWASPESFRIKKQNIFQKMMELKGASFFEQKMRKEKAGIVRWYSFWSLLGGMILEQKSTFASSKPTQSLASGFVLL